MDSQQTMPVRCALYARVSRLLGQSIENQVTPLTEFAKGRGYRIIGTYADEGVSGAKTKRPQLDALLKDCRAGKVDVIAVVALDRLGRDLKHLLSVLDELNGLGVHFVSLREGVDLTQPSGRLIMSVIGAICEFERSLIRTRIKEALAAKRMLADQTGARFAIGRPRLLDDELVRRIVELRNGGISIRAIEAAIDKRVSRGSIERALKAHRNVCPNKVEQIAAQSPLISISESEQSEAFGNPQKTTDIVTPSALNAEGRRR